MHRQRVAALALLATACGSEPAPEGPRQGDAGFGDLADLRASAIPVRPAPPMFRDVTGDSGVDLFVRSAEGIAGGAAVFDLDGDGALDLFVANEDEPSRLFRGRGDATFEDVSIASGISTIVGAMSAATADWDGDGDPDLFVGTSREDVLLRNDGGVLVDVTEASGVSGRLRTPSADFADVDGDGRLDLVLGDYEAAGSSSNRLYRGGGDGTFEIVPDQLLDGGMTLSVTFSDFDADGDVDLFETNDYGMFLAPNRLYANESTPGDVQLVERGTAVGYDHPIYGMGVGPLDFDADGDLDYYVTNAFYKLLLRNDGGSLTDVAREVGAGAYGWDDPLQLFYPFRDPSICADAPDRERCEAGMAFVDAYGDREGWRLGYTTFGPVVADFDQDGWEDLFLENGFVGLQPTMPEGRRQPDALLLGGPDGMYEQPDTFGAADRGDGRGAASGDFDGDGDPDLVVVNNGFDDPFQGRVRVFENVGARPGAFVRVRLVGSSSNRDAIGARVRAEIGGVTRVREVHGCIGFASCSERTVHLGTGTAESAERIEIAWPSGIVDVVQDVPAGTTIEIVEGT